MQKELRNHIGVSRRLLDYLEASWNYNEQLVQAELSISLGQLWNEVIDIAAEVHSSLVFIEKEVLRALNCMPRSGAVSNLGGWHAPAFRCKKFCDLAPLASREDLLAIALHPLLYRKFNAFFTQEAAVALHDRIFLVRALCP
jgi:hypothetical protein